MANVTILSGFDTYSERMSYVKEFFSKENKVTILMSDFKHFEKKKIDSIPNSDNDTKLIDTHPYYKNISIDRVKSHYDFAKKAYKELEVLKPDIIYALIPPNFLTYFLNSFKKKHPNTIVIFDVVDLWPEAFPVRRFKNNPFFLIWKEIRNRNLSNIDAIVTESDLFKEYLPQKYITKTQTVHLTREQRQINWKFNGNFDKVEFVYLGSVNNIIDINFIVNVCGTVNLNKEVLLHIIGDGEKIDELKNKLRDQNVDFLHHGKIYAIKEKTAIFNRCHFAFNVMKESVAVGLTMKSLDYFEFGLPLINNIKGDTNFLVEKYNCGINFAFDQDTIEELAEKILLVTATKHTILKENSRRVFELYFTKETFDNNMKKVMEIAIKNKEVENE